MECTVCRGIGAHKKRWWDPSCGWIVLPICDDCYEEVRGAKPRKQDPAWSVKDDEPEEIDELSEEAEEELWKDEEEVEEE